MINQIRHLQNQEPETNKLFFSIPLNQTTALCNTCGIGVIVGLGTYWYNRNHHAISACQLPLEYALRNWVKANPNEKKARLIAAEKIRNYIANPNISLLFDGIPISSIDSSILPPYLTVLFLNDTAIKNLVEIEFPSYLLQLCLRGTKIKSLEGVVFPNTLRDLDLSRTKIDSLKGVVFPNTLRDLDLSRTKIDSLKGVELPPSLLKLNLNDTEIDSLEGIVFPQTLNKLELNGTKIKSLNGIVFHPLLTAFVHDKK